MLNTMNSASCQTSSFTLCRRSTCCPFTTSKISRHRFLNAFANAHAGANRFPPLLRNVFSCELLNLLWRRSLTADDVAPTDRRRSAKRKRDSAQPQKNRLPLQWITPVTVSETESAAPVPL